MTAWWRAARRMMGTGDGRMKRARRGQAITEMALLTPFFMLILLGALDLGRIYIYETRLNSAIKEAAMLGLYQPNYPVSIAARAYQEVNDPATGRQLLGTPGVDFVVDEVTCYSGATGMSKSCVNPAPGDYIQVTGYYIFEPITSQILRFLPADQRIWKTVKAVF
jgi:hypothetical protein